MKVLEHVFTTLEGLIIGLMLTGASLVLAEHTPVEGTHLILWAKSHGLLQIIYFWGMFFTVSWIREGRKEK